MFRTPWKTTTRGLEAAVRSLYSHLFLQFAHAVYIFQDDCGGYDAVLQNIKAWIRNGSKLNLPRQTRPALVVVEYVGYLDLNGRSYCVKDLQLYLKVSAARLKNAFYSVHLSRVVNPAALRKLLFGFVGVPTQSRKFFHVDFSIKHTAALNASTR